MAHFGSDRAKCITTWTRVSKTQKKYRCLKCRRHFFSECLPYTRLCDKDYETFSVWFEAEKDKYLGRNPSREFWPLVAEWVSLHS